MNSPDSQNNSPKNIQKPPGGWFDKLSKFKSPMYYWHTERKSTAVLSILTTGLLSILLFTVTTGGLSILGILLALFADTAAVALILVVAWFFPAIAGIFGSQIVMLLVVPTLSSLLLARGVTYLIAKKRGQL